MTLSNAAKLIAAIGIISLLFAALPLRAQVLPVTRGGTGSTTLSGILSGTGTSSIQSAIIGSGLSWNGITLSALAPLFSLSSTTPWTVGNLTQVASNGSVRSVATSSLGLQTSDVGEGANLYFTDARARSALLSAFTNGAIPFANGTNLTVDAPNLFWDNTNKRFGIGTTDPIAKLQVNANGGGLLLATDGTGSNTVNIYYGSGTASQNWMRQNYEYGSSDLRFDRSPNGGSTWENILTLDYNAKYVGVNATAPTHPLTIGTPETPVGTAASFAAYQAGNGFGIFRDTTNDIELSFGTTNGIGGYIGTLTNHDLAFLTNNSLTPKMVIKSAGNVGIGSSNPAALLTVGGLQSGNAGLEVVPGSGVVVQSYNRTGGAYASLRFDGTTVGFRTADPSGSLVKLSQVTATTLTGATVGLEIDNSTNITNAAQNLTGISLATAPVTAAVSNTLRGITIAPGAVTNSSGATTYRGVSIQMPAITQSGGTLTSTGLYIAGGTVTSGTSYALIVDSTAGNVGIGTMSPVSRLAHLRDVTAQDLGVLLSHIPTADLYAFRRQCEKARSFSRYFWWALKPKPMTEGAGVRG